MKIEEVLNEYKFSNVGQFRGIAQSLGYKENYNKGELTFTLNNDLLRTSIDEIRVHTQKGTDLESRNMSMERICKFFDKDSILSLDYKKQLYDKEGVDIINWGEIGSDSKDRFTVIDHKNKISYTGKELYDYAFENGYVLNGKGTKLEKGVLSDLTDVKGKPAKLRLTEKGVSIFYRKEALVIPDKLLGKRLSEKQKKALLEGETIVLPAKKSHVFVSVDKDLNAVIVRSGKELSIPSMIGGRELTAADKYLLANGHSLDNMILSGDNGYFIADVAWTSDKKGISFSNIQNISETKAKELLEQRQQKEQKPIIKKEQMSVNEQKSRDMAAELREAVEKDDFEKMSRLKDEGYKPTEEVINGLGNIPNMDGKKALVIDKLFGLKPEVTNTDRMSPDEQEPGEIKGIEAPTVSSIPEQDQFFKLAVEQEDFAGLNKMKVDGYMPSKEIMQSLSETVSENSLIAVQKIFGLKSNAPVLADVKLANNSQGKTKDISRGVGSIVNKAFGDL